MKRYKINNCSSVLPSSAGRELEIHYYRVIPYVAGSRSKVDDGCSFRTAVGKGVHVGHHIVTQLLLLLRCHLEVDVVQICFHLPYLLISDWKPKRLQGEKNFHCIFSLPTNWDRSCSNNLLPCDICQKCDNLVETSCNSKCFHSRALQHFPTGQDSVHSQMFPLGFVPSSIM